MVASVAIVVPVALVSVILLIAASSLLVWRMRQHNVSSVPDQSVSDDKVGLTADPLPEMDELGRLPPREMGVGDVNGHNEDFLDSVGTRRSDGTRSFMKGWFALDSVASRYNTAHTNRTVQSDTVRSHQRLQSADDEEWTVDMELDEK